MLFCGGPLVLVAINTATYAPSAAASDARSDDEGDASEHRPRREAPCDEAERRPTRARSDPRPARVCDRAPAPPAPLGPRHSACGADRGQAEGLAGLCVASYASARVWPASRRSRICGHEYLGLAQKKSRVERTGLHLLHVIRTGPDGPADSVSLLGSPAQGLEDQS